MTNSELRTRLRQRLQSIEKRIAAACKRADRERSEVTLVAVTKTVSTQIAGCLAQLGILDLGESRPQELWKKAKELASYGIQWHMVGHLQRNKVEETLPHAWLIHSVDSLRLLEALNTQKGFREPRVLLEVNVSREESKHGFDPDEMPRLVEEFKSFLAVRIDGLMTMAAPSDDPEQSRGAFAELRQIRDELRDSGMVLPQLSMGMSNDFEVAIEEGATLIRLGSVLFEGIDKDPELEIVE
jgi:pyridoxal phosphate enzyme (YggS family)